MKVEWWQKGIATEETKKEMEEAHFTLTLTQLLERLRRGAWAQT
jgi:hypothetical protein